LVGCFPSSDVETITLQVQGKQVVFKNKDIM